MVNFNAARLWIIPEFIKDVSLKYLEDFKDGREGHDWF